MSWLLPAPEGLPDQLSMVRVPAVRVALVKVRLPVLFWKLSVLLARRERLPMVSLKLPPTAKVPPFRARVEELAKTLEAPRAKVPALTWKVPVEVLSPESVMVPEPCLVTLPVPEMMPEKVVFVASPVVRTPPVPRVTAPAPAREPMVSVRVLTLNVAPEPTVTAVVSARTLLAAKVRVPALMLVAPV